MKTGGLTPADALWAPATLAFSSLLVEGFAGLQMSGTARELRKRQLAHVRDTLIDQTLRPTLRSVARELHDDALTGISEAELQKAESAIADWERPHEH